MSDILSGIRVIELAAWTFVPAAGAVLADWGADVIKVEVPETGDPQRGPTNSGIVTGAGGVNHFVEQPNRGKRSIGLDTSNPDGLELLMKLLETADVFVTNLLPDLTPADGYRRRSGPGAQPQDHLCPRAWLWHEGRPAASGRLRPGGVLGARRHRRSVCGRRWLLSADPAAGLRDSYGGLAIAAGIAAALVKRERTGEPSVVDVSLLNAAIWQLGPDIVGAGITGQDIPKFQLDSMPNPVASIYKTRDNRFIAIVLLQADRFWADFCARLGRDWT